MRAERPRNQGSRGPRGFVCALRTTGMVGSRRGSGVSHAIRLVIPRPVPVRPRSIGYKDLLLSRSGKHEPSAGVSRKVDSQGVETVEWVEQE